MPEALSVIVKEVFKCAEKREGPTAFAGFQNKEMTLLFLYWKLQNFIVVLLVIRMKHIEILIN